MNKPHRVQQLPPEVVSKIAAGEVVERPASVVKELLENALDAGATELELTLSDAGKTAITARDNGSGIAADDLELIFDRHATSKISGVDDLFNIHSLGFRGEALYSIAAIADVTLKSRTANDETGWEVHLRGGERKGRKPVSMNPGTEITVRELFFNTPARRKFLKSDTSELNQVLSTVIPYTFLYPERRFRLTHGKKTLLDLEPAALKARVARALNLDEQHLLGAEQELPDKNCRLRVVLGDINVVRSRRDMQFFFVNGRPVQNKAMAFHLNDVYRLIFPPGKSPAFAVFLDVPATDVDANIHPTKREVKVRNEQQIMPALRQVVEHRLLTGSGAKEVRSDDAPPPAPDSRLMSGALTRRPDVERAWDDPPERGVAEPAPTEQYSYPKPTSTPGVDIGRLPGIFGAGASTLPDKLTRSRYIGPLINKFLLWEVDQSLLIIDQHAAQERITFEMLIEQMDKGRVEVQQLLSPYTIPLSRQEFLSWEEGKDQLEEMGFTSTAFDEETIAVHSYPVLIRDPERAVRDILAGGEPVRTDHESLARRACRASIRAGDALNREQAENMRAQLVRCKDPFTCPHGRPTVIEMKEDYLDKQFLRT